MKHFFSFMFIPFSLASTIAMASGTMGLAGLLESLLIMFVLSPILLIMSILSIIFCLKNKFYGVKYFVAFNAVTLSVFGITLLLISNFLSHRHTQSDANLLIAIVALSGTLALVLPSIQFVLSKLPTLKKDA